VITASHNPPRYNDSLKAAYGGSLPKTAVEDTGDDRGARAT
jgi:hypothetical protein